MQQATREAANSIQAIGLRRSSRFPTSQLQLRQLWRSRASLPRRIRALSQEAAKGTVEVASSIVEVNQGPLKPALRQPGACRLAGAVAAGVPLKAQVDAFLATAGPLGRIVRSWSIDPASSAFP